MIFHWILQAGRGERVPTVAENRSTAPRQSGRKSDPIIARPNQYANKNPGDGNKSMPGDGRKSSSSRDSEVTMPSPGQKVILCSI